MRGPIVMDVRLLIHYSGILTSTNTEGEFTLRFLDVRLCRNMQDCPTSTNFVCQQKKAGILTSHVRILTSFVRILKWCKNRQEFLQYSKDVGSTSFFPLGNSYILMQEFSYANVRIPTSKIWIWRLVLLTNRVCWCRNSWIVWRPFMGSVNSPLRSTSR